MNESAKQRYWTYCKIAAIIVTALSLSPLVIPMGTYKPMLAGIPYTIWTGFLASVVLVILTYIGTRVMPFEED